MSMPHPDYFIAFDDYRNQSLAEFANLLRCRVKKAVGSVQISELCSMVNYPNGLYLFFDDKETPWYIGKATSRSFIERVPSHFDQRQHAWFNTLPKKIMAVCQIGEYPEAHALGLSLRLVIIGIKSKNTALKLESVLRSFLQPKLNPGKKSRFSGREILSSYDI